MTATTGNEWDEIARTWGHAYTLSHDPAAPPPAVHRPPPRHRRHPARRNPRQAARRHQGRRRRAPVHPGRHAMTRPPAAAPPSARTRTGPVTPQTSLVLGAVDTAPGTARATLATTLALWELRHLTDDAQAITSELVTNAVAISINGAQARGIQPPPVMLAITARHGELCISVWDPDPTPPPRDPPPPDDDAESGRGLLIVDALATRWGWHPANGGGKYTWATLRTDAQPASEQQQDTP